MTAFFQYTLTLSEQLDVNVGQPLPAASEAPLLHAVGAARSTDQAAATSVAAPQVCRGLLLGTVMRANPHPPNHPHARRISALCAHHAGGAC